MADHFSLQLCLNIWLAVPFTHKLTQTTTGLLRLLAESLLKSCGSRWSPDVDRTA
jgi:hypothetical protein